MIQKFSVVRCPVCGEKGKILTDIGCEENIQCASCTASTKASRWDVCYNSSSPEEEKERLSQELEKSIRRVKAMAQALEITIDEVIAIIKK